MDDVTRAEVEELRAELSTLRRAHTRFRRAIMALVSGVAIVAVTVAADKGPTAEVVTRKLRVVDDHGAVAVVISPGDNGGAVYVYDRTRQKLAAGMTVHEDGGMITVRGRYGSAAALAAHDTSANVLTMDDQGRTTWSAP